MVSAIVQAFDVQKKLCKKHKCSRAIVQTTMNASVRNLAGAPHSENHYNLQQQQQQQPLFMCQI